MVAIRPIVCRRLPVFHQPLLVDFQMRMPFAVARRGHGMQHPYGARQALPVLRARMAGAGAGHDLNCGAAASHFIADVMALARALASRARRVSHRRRAHRVCTRISRPVLGWIGLADWRPLPSYWSFQCLLNPPTCSSSRSSSGLPSRSSMVAEADAAAVYQRASASAIIPPSSVPSPDRQGGDTSGESCLK